MIQLSNLTKFFADQAGGAKTVIDHLSLSLQPGEFVGVLGPSGCGKSTLLRLIAGLESADSGSIQITPESAKIGFVFQDPNLLPWLTVKENALLSFRLKNENPSMALLEEWLQKLNLTAARDQFPYELSGGMKMRASILRAMMIKPQLLLLDEPFAALDEVIRVELQKQLFHFCREQKLTVLLVTHSISEATKLCDRVLLMNYGGKVILDRKQKLNEYQFQMSMDQQVLAGEILKSFPQVLESFSKEVSGERA